MPPLPRVSAVPVGQLGNIGSIFPRSTPDPTTGTAEEIGRLQFETASTQFSTATEAARFGLQQTEESLGVLRKLSEAREASEADRITIEATLNLRGQIQALQSSGAHYSQWGPLAETITTAITRDAVGAAKKVSPAVVQHVQRSLTQEGANLILGVQRDSIAADISYQQGVLEQKEQFSTQEFFLRTTPEERVAVRESYVQSVERAVQSQLIRPADGVKRIQRFDKMIATEGAIELGVKGGLEAAFKYVDESPLLSPDEKRETRNRVHDAIRWQLQATEERQKALKKQIDLDQDVLHSVMYQRTVDPAASADQLLSDLRNIPNLVRTTALTRSHGDALTSAITSRLKDLNSPIPERNIPEVETELRYQIAANPDAVRLEDIRNMTGLTASTKGDLLEKVKQARDENHYTKKPAFRQGVRELEAINVRVATLPFEQARPIQLEVARAITEYERTVAEAQRLKGGTPLSNEEVMRLDTLVQRLVARITTERFSDQPGKSLGDFR